MVAGDMPAAACRYRCNGAIPSRKSCCMGHQGNAKFRPVGSRATGASWGRAGRRAMFGILGLGFLLGMQHALEADHVAAVSSIAARRSGVGDIVRHGLTWGLGHTLTLFLFASVAILLGRAIPSGLSSGLETGVGIMLVGLGGHVLWRLWRDRVHFHRHSHGNGTEHIHVHSHAGESLPHERSAHSHAHGFRWRTLIVGLMHGMAGSAALLVLTVSQAGDPLL